MILILRPNVTTASPEYQELVAHLARYPDVRLVCRDERGSERSVTEVHLVGDTRPVDEVALRSHPAVEQAIRVRRKYRIIGRHDSTQQSPGFDYQGVHFSQDTFELIAGLCAVDNERNTEAVFAALASLGARCARAGAYKPRTSPYDFQGHGAACLPYLFDLACKHGIKVLVMEVTHARAMEEIDRALTRVAGQLGVIFQIGTRNAQNFELLREAGRQTDHPILYKRGMGNTLEEALNACEYIASEGNRRIIFCLRGIKSELGHPHRNMVDFALVPVVRSLTLLPVWIDPSHSVGKSVVAVDGIPDIWHVAAQAVVAGANGVLLDVHPEPATALCDGFQAILPHDLPTMVEDLSDVRATYQRRRARLAARPIRANVR